MMFETDLAPIRSKIKQPDHQWKLIKLLEQWFLEKGVACDKEIFQTLRNIVALRNVSFPYHSTDTRIVDLVKFFDHQFPIEYVTLFDKILDKLMDSLVRLQTALNAARSESPLNRPYAAGDSCPFCSKEGKKGRIYPTGRRERQEPANPPKVSEGKAEFIEFECDTCHKKVTTYGRTLNESVGFGA